jgi:hypothetical protein
MVHACVGRVFALRDDLDEKIGDLARNERKLCCDSASCEKRLAVRSEVRGSGRYPRDTFGVQRRVCAIDTIATLVREVVQMQLEGRTAQ